MGARNGLSQVASGRSSPVEQMAEWKIDGLIDNHERAGCVNRTRRVLSLESKSRRERNRRASRSSSSALALSFDWKWSLAARLVGKRVAEDESRENEPETYREGRNRSCVSWVEVVCMRWAVDRAKPGPTSPLEFRMRTVPGSRPIKAADIED